MISVCWQAALLNVEMTKASFYTLLKDQILYALTYKASATLYPSGLILCSIKVVLPTPLVRLIPMSLAFQFISFIRLLTKEISVC
jgi:hypothetical protein